MSERRHGKGRTNRGTPHGKESHARSQVCSAGDRTGETGRRRLGLASCALALLLGSLGTAAGVSLWARGYGYAALGVLAAAMLTLVALRFIRHRRIGTRPDDSTAGIPASRRTRYRVGP